MIAEKNSAWNLLPCRVLIFIQDMTQTKSYFLKKSGILICCSFTVLEGVRG